jgi:hypothetical protein
MTTPKPTPTNDAATVPPTDEHDYITSPNHKHQVNGSSSARDMRLTLVQVSIDFGCEPKSHEAFTFTLSMMISPVVICNHCMLIYFTSQSKRDQKVTIHSHNQLDAIVIQHHSRSNMNSCFTESSQTISILRERIATIYHSVVCQRPVQL